MEVPRRVIDGYDESMRTSITAVQDELRASLALVDYSAPTAVIRTELVALMDAYCGAAADLGARISSEFYGGLREMVTGGQSTTSLGTGRDPKATERAVRAFISKLLEGDEEGFEDLLMERVELEAKRAAAYNTIENVRQDPDEPRFARVPQGEKTCDFCLMLASRGPVYLTEETAGAFTKYHAHCDCKVVPFWHTVADGPSRRRGISMSVEGYDPDALYQQWKHPEAAKQSTKEVSTSAAATPDNSVNSLKSKGLPGIGRARMRTGSMSSDDYAQLKRELEDVGHVNEIRIPKSEYAMVMHELNTNLTAEDKRHAMIFKPIRNHCYTVLNLGYGEYRIIGRTPID